MSELPPPSFRKTKSGKWAAMGPIETLEKAIASGGIVEVQKKSGDWSKFHVASLGKPFDVDGVQMAYGYGPEDEEEGAKRLAREKKSGGRPAQSSTSGEPAYSRAEEAPPVFSGQEPPRDDSEPLPEFQGDEEWVEEF